MAANGNAQAGGGTDPPAGGAEGAGAPAAGADPSGGCAPPGYRCVCTCVPPKEAVLPDADELPPADPPPPDTGGNTPSPPGGENPPPPAPASPGSPGQGITFGPSPGAAIDTGGPLSSWPWRQPGAWTAPGTPGNGAGSGLGAGIFGGAPRTRIPRIVPSRRGPPAAVAHPAAVTRFAGPQQDEASLGTALEDPTAAGPGPEEPWLVFPGDSTRSTRLLRFPDRLPVAPPFAGVFDLGGAWGSRDSGPGAVAGPGTEDGSERAGLWRESSMAVLAPPRFDGEGVRDLTEDRRGFGVEAPPGTPTAPSDRVDGDDADLDGDAMEPGWGEEWGSQAEVERGAPLSVALPAGPVVGSRPGPARPWEEGLNPRLPAVAPASPPAGIHPGAEPAGAAALLGRGAPFGGLPPSPRPSARPGVFAKPTLGKGGGSYEAARRAADDAHEFEGGRRYGKDETFGVMETLAESGAAPETVEKTRDALAEETNRAIEAKFAAEKKVYDNFSSEEQARARLLEADARYEKSREREDRKYAAMPNGAEARRANQAGKVARHARDRATGAKASLANNRREMTAKQVREAKRAVKGARDAAKAAKKAAREAQYAARNGTREQAKAAAEKAERLAAEAVAAAVAAGEAANMKKETGQQETAEGTEGEEASPAAEAPKGTGVEGGEGPGAGKGGCEEKDCGTCHPACDADQTCVCKWEKAGQPPVPGGDEAGGGTKGRGVPPPASPGLGEGKTPDDTRKGSEGEPLKQDEKGKGKRPLQDPSDVEAERRRIKDSSERRRRALNERLDRTQQRIAALLEKLEGGTRLSATEQRDLERLARDEMTTRVALTMLDELEARAHFLVTIAGESNGQMRKSLMEAAAIARREGGRVRHMARAAVDEMHSRLAEDERTFTREFAVSSKGFRVKLQRNIDRLPRVEAVLAEVREAGDAVLVLERAWGRNWPARFPGVTSSGTGGTVRIDGRVISNEEALRSSKAYMRARSLLQEFHLPADEKAPLGVSPVILAQLQALQSSPVPEDPGELAAFVMKHRENYFVQSYQTDLLEKSDDRGMGSAVLQGLKTVSQEGGARIFGAIAASVDFLTFEAERAQERIAAIAALQAKRNDGGFGLNSTEEEYLRAFYGEKGAEEAKSSTALRILASAGELETYGELALMGGLARGGGAVGRGLAGAEGRAAAQRLLTSRAGSSAVELGEALGRSQAGGSKLGRAIGSALDAVDKKIAVSVHGGGGFPTRIKDGVLQVLKPSKGGLGPNRWHKVVEEAAEGLTMQERASRVASSVLRGPSRLAEMFVEHLPLGPQRLTRLDRLSRFLLTATKEHDRATPILRLLKKLPGRIGKWNLNDWQQSHLAIQAQWFRGSSRFALFPEGSQAIVGLRALGNAGFNLAPLPTFINQGLKNSPWIMSAFGMGIQGGAIYGTTKTAEHVYEGVREVLREDWNEQPDGR